MEVGSYIRVWPIPKRYHQGNSQFWNASMIKGECLTEILISFAVINDDDGASICFNKENPPFTNLWDEVAALKKKFPHLKVFISIGGWGADGFSDMAIDPAKRLIFTANVCDWLEKHDLAGADIDWEYPVGSSPDSGLPIKTRPQDRENYIAMLQDLREAMNKLGVKTGKRYLLTSAMPAQDWFIKKNDIQAAIKILDAFKIMNYDYYGSWSNTTGHHTGFSLNPDDPDGWSTVQSIEAYLNAGVPPEKINVGCGFYGRSFQGVEGGPNNDGLFQPFKSIPPYDSGSDSNRIEDLLKPGSGYTRYWDKIAQSPYLYNGDIWITYSDEEQLNIITSYAKEKKLGGVFYWEYGNDMNGELLKVLYEGAK